MPATSEPQRKMMCYALSVKLGKASASKASEQVRRLARTMSVKQLSDFCKSPVKKG